MSIQSLVLSGRRLAESLMIDTCTVQNRTGETTGAGGVVTPTWTTIYTGQCRMKTENTVAQGTDIGEAYRLVSRKVLWLPATATGLQEGDRVTVTASTLDPDLVGRVYTVQDVDRSTYATRREVTILEVTS